MEASPGASLQERGRPRQKAQRFRGPFDSIKSILNRKLNLNRSLSRDRSSSLPKFSQGTVSHAHNISTEGPPPLYLTLNIDQSGAIIRPEQNAKVGTCICNCGEGFGDASTLKQITFSTKPVTQLAQNEHFVSSNFIVPETSEYYKRVYKSYPILYRMDLVFDGVQQGHPVPESITFVNLKTTVHAHLMRISNLFEEDLIQPVYEKLFDISPSAPALSASGSEGGAADLVVQDVQDEREPLWHPWRRDHHEGDADDQVPPLVAAPSQQGQQMQQDTDFPGILCVRTDSGAPWEMPRAESVGVIAQYLMSWSQSGMMSIFMARNLLEQQLDFYVFRDPKPLNTKYPLVFSPQRTAFVLSSCSQTLGLNSGPQLSLQNSPKLVKWFSYLYDGIAERSLFRESAQPVGPLSSVDSDEEEDISQKEQAREEPCYRSSHPPKLAPSLSVEVYTPPILKQSDCPEPYKVFWSLKAFPRQLVSIKGKVGASTGSAVGERFVAPRYPMKMMEVANHINMPGLLATEFEAYAKVYQAIVNERKYWSVDHKDGDVHISIINDASVLARLAKGKILDDLKRNAPMLREQRLDQLTEAELQSFFFQARNYLLDNSAPYWSFSDYFLNQRTFGSDVYNKVTEILLGFPTYKATLRQFSSFIEHSIRQILPIQESYTDSEERIVQNHRSHLLAPVPSADHTKISLQADAQELLIKSPYYKQNHTSITEEFKRKLIEMEKANLLFKVISNTHYEKDLIQLLIANDKYPSLDKVPCNVVITNLENLILVGQKAESIEVNMARNSRSPKPRSKTVYKKSPVSPIRAKSPRSQSKPRSSLQEACDTCLLFEFDPSWCQRENHCRVSGHQPSTNRSQTREKQIRSGDLSSFVIHTKCGLCFPQRVYMSFKPPDARYAPPPAPPPVNGPFHVPPPFGQPSGHRSHPGQLECPPPSRQPPPPRQPSRSPPRYQVAKGRAFQR